MNSRKLSLSKLTAGMGALAGSLILLSVTAVNVSANPAPAPGAAPLSATPAPTTAAVVLATSVPTFSTEELENALRYTVQPGDTLYSIARRHGVTVAVIQGANEISDPNDVKAGQELLIPGAKDPAATPAATETPAPAATATPAVSATPEPQPTEPPQPAATRAPSPEPSAQAQSGPAGDPLYFEETGFRIANDRFWDYFNRRGGVRTFGYPISKEFLLFGFRVQMFQRAIMQLQPDGSVTTMNLLDEGMMPYTNINFSSFPAPDKGMADAAPNPAEEGYFDKLLAFVDEKSPDAWNDLSVNFKKTFDGTVRYEEAYPDKSVEPGIMRAINLEMWGAPTSAPAYDPTNKNFVYLRFQRGIMHYDKSTGATQGLLLGDYLKSIMTGWNLPPDLEEQAKGSPFYRQYNPLAPDGLNRPDQLPGTTMKGAFTRDGLVVIDPGHGGTQIGAAHAFSDGTVLVEKDVNLKLALKTAELLRGAGRQVLLTRTADTQVNNPPRDVTGNGSMTLDDDLMARIDMANDNGAGLFVSIHFNGNNKSELRGTEVYYNAKRPFSDINKKFAQLMLDSVMNTTKAAGFTIPSRGIKQDEAAVGKGNSFYLLGPKGEDKPRESLMPGALVEGAFLTNPDDAALVKNEKFLDALATAYAQGIEQYFNTLAK